MPRYRRAHTPGATYFFTVVTFRRRRRFLCDEDVRTALRRATVKVRRKYPFTIDAWVLLPDHLHCIWTLPEGDADFSRRWNLIKRYVTRACKQRLHCQEWIAKSRQRQRESTLWQRRFWEHRIRDENDFAAHMEYLHYNPVKHGLCRHPSEWPYSTLHRLIASGVYPPGWADDEPPRISSPLDRGEI